MGHQPFGLLAGLQRSGGSVLKRWVGPRPSGDARGRCPPGSGCLRVGTPPFPADRRSGSSVPCLTLSTIAWLGACPPSWPLGIGQIILLARISRACAGASWRRRVGTGRIILRRRSIGRACGRRIEGGAGSGSAGSFSVGAASAAPAAGASKAAPSRDRPEHSPAARQRSLPAALWGHGRAGSGLAGSSSGGASGAPQCGQRPRLRRCAIRRTISAA